MPFPAALTINLVGSRTSIRPVLQQAFTLIEILIVLVIIGIVTATTLITVGHNGSMRRLEATASTLQNTFTLAQEQAILTTKVIGISLTKNSYRFYQFSTDIDKENKRLNARWLPIKNNSVLTTQTIPDSISLTFKSKNDLFQDFSQKIHAQIQPQIIILPSGGFTSFTLILRNKDGKNAYQIKGDMAGNLAAGPLLEDKSHGG